MKINCFPIKMTEEEAVRTARRAGGPIGRFIFGGKPIHLRVMYLESRYYIFEMTYVDHPLAERLRGRKEAERQNIRIMVEATTCSAAYVAEEISAEEREVDETLIQPTYYNDTRLENCGRIMAKRLVRRHLGRNLTIRPIREEKVYRPFYIAIYGDMAMGTKARYLPIAADGYAISRTF